MYIPPLPAIPTSSAALSPEAAPRDSPPHPNRPVAAGPPLRPLRARHDTMQFKHLGMRDRTALRVLFHETQPGKVICHLQRARCAVAGISRPSSIARTCSRVKGLPSIAVEGWSIANPRVLLQGRDSGHLNRRCQNPLTRSRDLLYLREQYRRNRVNGLITHVELVERESGLGQVPQVADFQAAVQESPEFSLNHY